jgi:hypothetical protein
MPDRFYDYAIAKEFGLVTAVIYGRIKWSIESHKKNNDSQFFEHDDWWMYDTLDTLAEYVPCGINTAQRAINALLKAGFIKVKQLRKKTGDMTNFYALDIPSPQIGAIPHNPKMGLPSPQNGVTHDPKMGSSSSTKNLPRVILKLTPPIFEELEMEKKDNVIKLVKPPKQKKGTFTEEDFEIAKLWLDYALRERSWGTPPAAWTVERFAIGLAKVRTYTGMNYDGLRAMLNFVEKSDFWASNAWSPEGLLKKSKNGDDMRKVDHIIRQMKTPSDRHKERVKAWGENPKTIWDD